MFIERRPVIPDGGRVIAILVAALAAFVVVVLGSHYADTSHPGRADRQIDHDLFRLQLDHRRLFLDVTNLGGPVAITVMAVILGGVLFLLGRPRAALLAAAGPALAAAITELVLKPLVGRTISGVSGYSFPSGHTTGIFSVAFVIVVAVLDRKPPRLRPGIAIVVSVIALIVAAGVAAALVGVHYHYATDTVGGACVALATVLVVGLGIDLVFDAL